MSVFTHLVAQLGRLLEPVLAESATAAAIVLFTVLVRLALYPMSRAAFRAPTPMAGCLPLLLQLPVFFVMYQAFSSAQVGGEANRLLGHRLFAAPLGGHWTGALEQGGLFGAQGLVFLGLFAAIAVVAAWSAVRARRTAAKAGTATATGAGTGGGAGGAVGAGAAGGLPELSAEQQELMRKVGGVLPLLSFGTLITAALVPLAAGLYLLTTTAWTVAERAWLQSRKDRAERAQRSEEGAAAASAERGARSGP
ncbi:YidC/Oxa1 family membrane protein insertase [Streptomyces sp. NPDC055254]